MNRKLVPIRGPYASTVAAVGIGAEIRRARIAKGYTQLTLAERVGIHHAHLSNVERGKWAPSEDLVVRISKVLRMPALRGMKR